ncbi:MAG: MFS transporter [Eggerthellaceae bacterium]|nr:MFS transporter [Eggerthellaceae bacterium]
MGVVDGGSQRSDLPAEKRQNFLLVSVVIFLVGVASVMVQMKLTTILPSLTERFAMGQTEVSLLMSMFTFVGLILALPVGFAAKRFGARAMLVAGVGFVVLGSLVGAVAGGSTMLILSRAIEGIAYIIIITCGPLAIERYVAPERLGTAMGIWGTYGCGGTLISGVITPRLYEAVGYLGLWMAYAVFALITGLLFLFVVKDPGGLLQRSEAARAKAVEKDGSSDTAAEAEGAPGYGVFFKPNMLLFLFPYVCYNVIIAVTLSFSPTFMQSEGMSPAESGMMLTTITALALFSCIGVGMLVDRFGRCKPFYLIGLLIMGPATYLLCSTTGFGMWIAVALVGIFVMPVSAVCPTAFVRILDCPAMLGVGMGVLKLMQCLGQTIGNYGVPMLLGADMSNWPLVALVSLVVGLVGAGGMLLCKYR